MKFFHKCQYIYKYACLSCALSCRWIFGKSQLCGKDTWFHAHVACQLLGFAAFVAGMVLGLTLKYEVSIERVTHLYLRSMRLL